VKKIAVIPSLLTIGNAVCGFAALACGGKIDLNQPATEYYFAYGGWLIIAAMLFDAFDGYVARLARTVSKFGAELDSLCDVVSFGVAPAFLLLKMGPPWERPLWHQMLACIAALYMVCAILRLARFNVESVVDPSGGKRFRGLPSPGAAGCLASLSILRGEAGNLGSMVDAEQLRAVIMVWSMLGALVVALLMVSRVPYPHVTKQVLRGKRHFSHLVQFIVIAFFVVIIYKFAAVLIFWIYGLGIPARYFILRSLRREKLPGTQPPEPNQGIPP
jgi:CDP-diacylglycerol--serine O-phosphatidyltransferase